MNHKEALKRRMEIVARFEAGESTLKLAQAFGMCPNYVKRIAYLGAVRCSKTSRARKLGLTRRERAVRNEAIISALKADGTKASVLALAGRYGLQPCGIHTIGLKAGVACWSDNNRQNESFLAQSMIQKCDICKNNFRAKSRFNKTCRACAKMRGPTRLRKLEELALYGSRQKRKRNNPYSLANSWRREP